MSRFDDRCDRVEDLAQELDEVVTTLNTFAENTSRIDAVEPFPVDKFTDIPNDVDEVREVRSTAYTVREQYEAAVAQLEKYAQQPKGVGPFPIDAIERTLQRHTSYKPSWVPSDDEKTAGRLGKDLSHKLERLDEEVQGLEVDVEL